MLMVVETESLRWFQQVAEGVTVTEVGELYRISQSGVSRGIARLEAEVGAPLLQRSGRTLRMTAAGAAFKRHVDALLNDLDDGLAAVEQLVDPETGTVTLAFQLSLGTWLVPGLVAGFRAAHPQVRFALQQSRDELVSSVLETGDVDLEISTLRRTGPSIRWHRLLTEPLCLAVPADHPLAGRAQVGRDQVGRDQVDRDKVGRGQVDLAVASSAAFVTLRPASLLRAQGAQLCEAAGFTPRVVLEGDDIPTVRGFVAAGLGVAIIPASRPDDENGSGGRVRYLAISDPAARRLIGLAWSSERRLLPAADLFRQYVIETTRRH